jgi:DNA-binding NarL/FixJ family response regulator
MSEIIRVLIVTREAMIRRGLTGFLAEEDSLQIVGSVDTAEEGYRLADEFLPGVALIGTTLTDGPGLQTTTEFRRQFPAIAVIVIAAHESGDELFSAIRAGAAAYCGQGIDESKLVSLIRRCASGEYVINEQLTENPEIAIKVIEEFRKLNSSDLPSSTGFAPLTGRELEILVKVSQGMTNAGIGNALGISAQTVKNHITSILKKLQVNDRTQAVVLAIKNGWISLDDGLVKTGR